MKLLDRYILSELLPPFFFGVAAFTGIMTASTVLFHLVTLMVRHGLPIGLVAAGVLIERIGYPATVLLYAGIGIFFTVAIAVVWRKAVWE